MNHYVAELSEIISAQRRDDEQIQKLTEQLSIIVKSTLGDLAWIRWYRYFPNICRLFYYSSTNILGLQTVGEEYLTLVQVSDSAKHPSMVPLYRRILFVILESFGDIFVKRVLERLDPIKRKLISKGSQDRPRRIVLILLSLIDSGLGSLHRAIFFAFHAMYYTLPKRLSSVSYISLRPQTNAVSRLFTFIGFCAIAQCFLPVFIKLFKEALITQSNISQADILIETEKVTRDPNYQCTVCLSRKPPVSMPCGHLLCWDCILEYAETEEVDTGRGKCPSCRSNFALNRVVPLINY